MKLENKRKLIHPKLLLISLVMCMAFLASASLTFAQTATSGTLRGTVKDPQGAVVSGAKVTMTRESTKEERSAITNDEGGYVFTAVTPDTYTIKVESQGFKTTQQTGVSVQTSSVL